MKSFAQRAYEAYEAKCIEVDAGWARPTQQLQGAALPEWAFIRWADLSPDRKDAWRAAVEVVVDQISVRSLGIQGPTAMYADELPQGRTYTLEEIGKMEEDSFECGWREGVEDERGGET